MGNDCGHRDAQQCREDVIPSSNDAQCRRRANLWAIPNSLCTMEVTPKLRPKIATNNDVYSEQWRRPSNHCTRTNHPDQCKAQPKNFHFVEVLIESILE